MLTLAFIRTHAGYCLIGIVGLALLISGNLLGSLGVAEIFMDPADSGSSDVRSWLWGGRPFAAQFYAAIFVAMVFTCFLARHICGFAPPGLNVPDDGVLWRAVRYHGAYILLPLPILCAALAAAPTADGSAAAAALAGFATAQVPIFLWLTYLAGSRKRQSRAAIWLVIGALFVACLGLLLNPLTPGDAFFAIFGWLTLAYIIAFYSDWRLLLVVALAISAWLSLAGHATTTTGHEPYRLPGLMRSANESYYAEPHRGPLIRPGQVGDATCGVQAFDNIGCSRRAPDELLQTWRDRRGLAKPKIVVVAASGGAYRATFWTAHVLDRLAELSAKGGPLEGFTDHIRLVTGASGGMVGVTYFAVCRREGEGSDAGSIAAVIEHDVHNPSGKACTPGGQVHGPIDSLLPVADHLARRDLFDVLFPRRHGTDRGKVLEQQWRSIGLSFEEMVGLQESELRPAIIFSPTIVETGTPLEIASLRWSHRANADDHPNLFDTFPQAHSTLALSTAARLSATYPVLTPAAELPTAPRALHLVDAGYFDNDGSDAAARYLREPKVMNWLAANSSGVILLSLRAFPRSEAAGPSTQASCKALAASTKSGSGLGAHLGRLLKGIADLVPGVPAPLRALAEVRTQAANRRSNVVIEHVKVMLENRGIDFDHVIFESAASVNMSWYLKRLEFDCLRETAREASAIKVVESIWGAYRQRSE